MTFDCNGEQPGRVSLPPVTARFGGLDGLDAVTAALRFRRDRLQQPEPAAVHRVGGPQPSVMGCLGLDDLVRRAELLRNGDRREFGGHPRGRVLQADDEVLPAPSVSMTRSLPSGTLPKRMAEATRT